MPLIVHCSVHQRAARLQQQLCARDPVALSPFLQSHLVYYQRRHFSLLTCQLQYLHYLMNFEYQTTFLHPYLGPPSGREHDSTTSTIAVSCSDTWTTWLNIIRSCITPLTSNTWLSQPDQHNAHLMALLPFYVRYTSENFGSMKIWQQEKLAATKLTKKTQFTKYNNSMPRVVDLQYDSNC